MKDVAIIKGIFLSRCGYRSSASCTSSVEFESDKLKVLLLLSFLMYGGGLVPHVKNVYRIKS